MGRKGINFYPMCIGCMCLVQSSICSSLKMNSGECYDGTVIWMAAKFVLCILSTCQITGIHQVIWITSAVCLCRCFMCITEIETNL
jgi:hypothetical protein